MRDRGGVVLRSELIAKIATMRSDLMHRDAERIVTVVFDAIVDALARGERVELRGFGAFIVRHRSARQGRNPRTGVSVAIEEKLVPYFKTGKELRGKLNEKVHEPRRTKTKPA